MSTGMGDTFAHRNNMVNAAASRFHFVPLIRRGFCGARHLQCRQSAKSCLVARTNSDAYGLPRRVLLPAARSSVWLGPGSQVLHLGVAEVMRLSHVPGDHRELVFGVAVE
jgi:hypothetical protein